FYVLLFALSRGPRAPHSFPTRRSSDLDLAGYVRGGDGKPQALENFPHLEHLGGVGVGQLAGADPQVVLETDAHVAALGGAGGGDGHLLAAGTQYGPFVVVAEQTVGGALHMLNVIGVGADAAEDAEYRLDEERGLDQAAVDEVGEVVEMGGVVRSEEHT